MKTLLLLLLPGLAHAWDLVTPGRRQDGVVSVTTITDVMSMTFPVFVHGEVLPNPNVGPGHWVSFADDVGDGCRLISNTQPNDPDLRQATGYSFKNRYVLLDQMGQLPAVLLPTALFARANNLPVRVKLVIEEGTCRVTLLQTCSNPDNCAP